jgi:outer membrane protein assembly factor BamD (BamD/ComL family)
MKHVIGQTQQVRRRLARPGLVLVVVLLAARIATADQPRARTLTYDPDRKAWTEVPPPPPGTPEGDLHAIRLQIGRDQFKPSLKAIKAFTKRYGESVAVWPQVLVVKARALIGLREYDKAHKVLQAFLSEYAGIELTSEALQLEFIIAEAYLGGAKRKLWGLRLLSGEDMGLRILDEIAADYPETELAELATKTKADYLFRIGEHGLAQLEYTHLQREYPQSRYQPYAHRRSAEAALASFAGVFYDEAALVEAAERYEEYRIRYPSRASREGVDLILDRIRETRSEKDFLIGAYYERTEHLGSAVFYYRWVLDQWPDTLAAAKAAERLELLGAARSIGSSEASDR